MIAEMPKLTPKSSSKKKKPEAMALTDPAGVVEDLPLKMEAPVTLDESKFVRFPNSPYQLYQPFLRREINQLRLISCAKD
jgi:excinuclease ABC subunit B